jgi:hypothetical protein
MGLVFRVRVWEGMPQVREPGKCLRWGWWPPHELPEPIVPYTRHVIEQITAQKSYSEWGW